MCLMCSQCGCISIHGWSETSILAITSTEYYQLSPSAQLHVEFKSLISDIHTALWYRSVLLGYSYVTLAHWQRSLPMQEVRHLKK